jgi:hypothetical protein
MNKYTLGINELLNRPIIRNDHNEEWINKMTDEEISLFHKECLQFCLDAGVENKFPDINAAIIAKHIDFDIIYRLIKIAKYPVKQKSTNFVNRLKRKYE